MFQTNIKKLREKRGLTQADLARELSISQNALYRIEKGTLMVSVPVAIEIAEILGCTLDELLLVKE